MNNPNKYRARLINLLKELFQLDQPELDFGLYNIIHAKSEQEQRFFANDLLKKMDQTASKIKDKSSNIEMILVNLNTNKEKITKAVIIQKEGDKKLFRYNFPTSDEGIANLSLPND